MSSFSHWDQRPCVWVGLGNPGSSYRLTPHNVGFEVIDRLMVELNAGQPEESCQSLFWKWQGFYFIQPQTYMNLSGRSLRCWLERLRVESSQLLVIHDEWDLPLGQFRLVWNRSPAGHNGVKDIHRCLGSGAYWRLRVGIRPEKPITGSLVDYVLSPQGQDFWRMIESVIPLLVQFLRQPQPINMAQWVQKINTFRRDVSPQIP